MSDVLTPPTGGAPPQPTTHARRVWPFEDGDGTMKDLLGGKGAGLAEMTRAGLPVPPGFTITTEACLDYYRLGRIVPDGLEAEVEAAMGALEAATGKTFGGGDHPLLVSVRSGARVSMPGMMDTILNLGLNDETVEALAALTGNERFAWDAYRRFITMFASVVLDVPKEHFEHLLDAAKASAGVATDPELGADSWKDVDPRQSTWSSELTGAPFPQDVHRATELADRRGLRLVEFEARNGLPSLQPHSRRLGHGGQRRRDGLREHGRRLGHRRRVHARTRTPVRSELFGEYLRNAQGEDVVAGIRTPRSDRRPRARQPEIYASSSRSPSSSKRTTATCRTSSSRSSAASSTCCRRAAAKRSAEAAVKIALDMVHEGLIDRKEEAIRASSAASARPTLFFARIDPHAHYEVVGTRAQRIARRGHRQIVFDRRHRGRSGEKRRAVILVRNETAPDDVHGMIAARGVFTCKGGATSHAAVVARGMGKPCVCGFESLTIDERATATIGGPRAARGRLADDRRHDRRRRVRCACADPAAVGAAAWLASSWLGG
jgi:pyruvate,orthophosphate dikinase